MIGNGVGARHALWRWVRPVAAILLVVLIALPAYRLSVFRGMEAARTDADHRLELFASAVDGIIMRLEHIPATVELNPDVQALLRAPAGADVAARVNAYLDELNRQVGAISVYVLDEHGVVVAASNWQERQSLIGKDLSFRTYFRWALGGLTGRHFAVGTAEGEPGYYVSRPVRDGGVVVGVTVVKIGLGELDEALGALTEPALIADSNGVVIMSPVAAWRYTALEPLSAAARIDAARSRLYDAREIRPFPVPMAVRAIDDATTLRLPAARPAGFAGAGRAAPEHLVVVRPLERVGWWLVLFPELSAVHRQALAHAALAATASGLLLMLMVYIAQRRRILRQRLETQAMLERANLELEATVLRRTQDLSDTNARLRREVAEREAAEKTLRDAQDELVQAGKLAVLGQLATGITHELTQPLGAIRTLSGNAAEYLRRGAPDKAGSNLELVTRLADQMGAIITPLRSFARKSPAMPSRVNLAASVRNALLLVDPKLRAAAVALVNRVPDTATAWCDRVRLEQVLVNLIGNAADAMAGQPDRSLEIAIEGDAEWPAALTVSDSGPGLPPEVMQRLFEPFFTTKPPGEGLGLGLAISRDIVREFGGELRAESRSGGGACFRITLPAPNLESCR